MPPAAPEPPEPAAGDPHPLAAATFAAAMAAFGPFEQAPAIAVGVSGGPDSMALALLLRDWVTVRGGSLAALVVDHRLRPESTSEARLVAARLAALGIEARILTRDGPLPASALQAKARTARYALMAAAAAEAGILHLALAHHAADQAETVALRLAAGSGSRGAAGMPAIRELDRVRLIRPLLGVAPGALRALLERDRVPWLSDPSNLDPRFWRGRHRQGQPRRAPSPPPDAAAAARRTLDAAAAAILARHVRPDPAGFVTIAAAPLVAMAPALRRLVLAQLVLATSGAAWPPGRAKLARLDAWVQQAGLQRQSGRRTALGGVLIERTGTRLRFVREPRAVAGPARLAGRDLLWDGRFRISRAGPGPTLDVRAAGPGWRHRLVDHDTAGQLPAVVLQTLPLISADDRPLLLGPWPLDPAARGLACRFRPRCRHTAVPFGPSVSPLVASPGECLMYGNACGEAPGGSVLQGAGTTFDASS